MKLHPYRAFWPVTSELSVKGLLAAAANQEVTTREQPAFSATPLTHRSSGPMLRQE